MGARAPPPHRGLVKPWELSVTSRLRVAATSERSGKYPNIRVFRVLDVLIHTLKQHVVLHFKRLFRIYNISSDIKNQFRIHTLYPSLPVTATKQLPGATTLTTWGQNNINKLQWGDDWMSLTEKKCRKFGFGFVTFFSLLQKIHQTILLYFRVC